MATREDTHLAVDTSPVAMYGSVKFVVSGFRLAAAFTELAHTI